jgi:hypothetical protein
MARPRKIAARLSLTCGLAHNDRLIAFWEANEDAETYNLRAVVKRPGDRLPKYLVADEPDARSLVIDGERVYWPSPAEEAVLSVRLTGEDQDDFVRLCAAGEQPGPLTIKAGRLYWLDRDKPGCS